MSTDWREWHELYTDPESSLRRRLETVVSELRRLLVDRRGRGLNLTSICAGDGRDTLPVLADLGDEVDAVLVEIDEHLSDRARETAAALGLDSVDIRTADAGLLSSLAGVPPADVFLVCGVFGNITDADLDATISAMPTLLAPNAHVIWTRGANLGEDEVSEYPGDPSDLVVCGGLEPDRLGELAGGPSAPRIIPSAVSTCRSARRNRISSRAWSTRSRTRATRSSGCTSPDVSAAASRSAPTPSWP